MADIIEGTHPTRMELLEIKKKIKLAEKGHRLLKEKRDALITEFFEAVKRAKGIRAEVTEAMDSAYLSLARAEAMMTSRSVESIAAGMPESVEVEVDINNIMGVRVPKFNIRRLRKEEFNYGLVNTPPSFDQTVSDWDSVVSKMLVLVEVEETLKRLAEEIKKTKRRVNALEYIMLPRLNATKKYIGMRLEEVERENFFRLKTIKKKKQNNTDLN